MIIQLVHHLLLADNIIVLNSNGQISEQGNFEDLRSRDGFVSQVILKPEILREMSRDPDDTANSGRTKKEEERLYQRLFGGPLRMISLI